jgi:hypothetical protein
MQLISGSPKIVNSADLLPPVVDDDLSVAVDLYMPSVVAVAPVSEIHMMLLSKALMEKTAKSLEVSLISATTMTLAPPASAPVGLELAVCEAAVLLLLWIVVYFLVLLHLSPSSLGLLSAQDSWQGAEVLQQVPLQTWMQTLQLFQDLHSCCRCC